MSGRKGRHEGGGEKAARQTTLSSVTGTGAAASIALGLLVLVCAFVAVSVPRASLGYRTEVLQRTFRAAPSTQTTVLADANITGLSVSYLTATQLAVIQRNVAAGLHRDGLPLSPSAAQWAGLTTTSTPVSGGRPPATGAGAPFPPVQVVIPWGWTLLLALGIAAVPVLAAAAAAMYRPDPAAQLRAGETA